SMRLQQVLAAISGLVADLGAERVVAGVAQPRDIFAAPAAPVEHIHLVALQAEALARQLEIADDLRVRLEGRELIFGQVLVVGAHANNLNRPSWRSNCRA